MGFLHLLKSSSPPPDALPAFVSRVDDIDGVRTVRLTGAIDHDIGAEVKQANASFEKSKDVFHRSVLLDFRDVTHTDSSTVAFLVDALRRRVASNARVGLLNPSQSLLSALEIARTRELFDVFDSEEEALASLGGSSGSSDSGA